MPYPKHPKHHILLPPYQKLVCQRLQLPIRGAFAPFLPKARGVGEPEGRFFGGEEEAARAGGAGEGEPEEEGAAEVFCGDGRAGLVR